MLFARTFPLLEKEKALVGAFSSVFQWSGISVSHLTACSLDCVPGGE